MSLRPHVVIVGGGFGGLWAARALKKAPVRITLVDRHNHHVFQPLLYQVATAALSPGDIASPIRWILRRQQNVEVLLAEARDIDVNARTVALDRGESLKYDYLVVAAGAANAYFGHDEWARHAPALKTLDDALRIRTRMLLAYELAEREPDPARRQRLLTFVVVGGGPTGVELAGAIAEIARQTLADEFRRIETAGARVILAEATEILSSFPDSLRQAARQSLRRLGVELREGTHVTAIDEGCVALGDESIAVDTVIWAAGVAAAPIGRSLGAETDRAGRVIVQADLTIPGHSEVFVVGDLARFADAEGKPLPGVAQVAMQQASHVGRNIRRALESRPLLPFHYRDFGSMATIGRNSAIADFGWLRVAGFPAWLIWLFIHIFWLIGFRNRLTTLIQWAGAYFTYQRSVRLITDQRRDTEP